MRVLVPLADGFEDIEAVAVIDILRRAGIEVDTVGIIGSMITSSNGIRVMADKKIDEIDITKYNGIILPGGSKGTMNLSKSSKVSEFLKYMNKRGNLIAAICAAPSILAKNGLLDDKKATIHPGLESGIPYPRAERVVVDYNVITSQAPGTSMEFALAIVKYFLGDDTAERLRESLLIQLP